VFIFATIGGVGFVLLVGSLIFGGDADHDLDHDVDHGHGGPSIFSIRMIALLMVGFGCGGYGVRATTDASMLLSTLAGLGGALIVGLLGYALIRLFYTSQASSTVTDQDIVGNEATLLDSVPENGVGQISCTVHGREITYMARSSDGHPIKKGARVRVLRKSGTSVTIEPID
jgi:membrane protein implicated in regulation of membrane protease activity